MDDNSSNNNFTETVREDEPRKKQGRKVLLDPAIMNQFFIDRKDEIMSEQHGTYKPVSKKKEVWQEIADAVTAKIREMNDDATLMPRTANSMYSHVSCNRHKIMDILSSDRNDSDQRRGDLNESSLLQNSTVEFTESADNGTLRVIINVPVEDFASLIRERETIVKRKKGRAVYKHQCLDEGKFGQSKA